ncbi:MAG TPA: DUF5982 domain-containing protein [Bacteroidia bacterium]
MKSLFKFSFIFSFSFIAHAQVRTDSVHLPFVIATEKRLSDEDLQNKKEGIYLTGIPDISSDPINGIGFGAEGQLFFNGKKSDPFFAFTPFRSQINLTLFYTTRAQREIRAEWEIPYVFNTKWRLHGELGYEVDPNLLYFGNTENSLKALSYYQNGDSAKPLINNASYNDYEKSLTGNKSHYNTYQKDEKVFNLIMERSFLEGKWRIIIGYEFTSMNMSTPLNNNSLLHKEALEGKIKGYGSNYVPLYQAGVIYDTRDLETDPSNGSFAELMNESSPHALGSQYNFNKTFFHYNIYSRIFSHSIRKLIFAGSAGIGYTLGDAPFYEYMDEESAEKTIEALGGSETLRGYKLGRFVSRAIEYTDLELRCRFLQCDFLKQHLAFSAVPFFDIGGVWDSLDRIGKTQNLRYSEGLGMRIAWNENTILRFDYAVSKEDKQFFFTLSHPF